MRSPTGRGTLIHLFHAEPTARGIHSTGARERRRRRKPGGHPFFLHLDNLSSPFEALSLAGRWHTYIHLAEPTVRGIITISKRGLTLHGASLAGPYLHCVALGILWVGYCLMVFVFLTELCSGEGGDMITRSRSYARSAWTIFWLGFHLFIA
jgi:hypothetical protein